MRKSRPARLDPRFARPDLDALVDTWQSECGQRVKRRRELLGVHRCELADLVGTTEASIIRIETGRQNARDGLRLAIAGVLRCEVADLWTYPTCEKVHDYAQAVA